MMATQVSQSQQASAEMHLSRQDEWQYFWWEGTRYVSIVSGRSNRIHVVRADARDCDCAWYQSGHMTCSHMIAVARAAEAEADIEAAFATVALRSYEPVATLRSYSELFPEED